MSNNQNTKAPGQAGEKALSVNTGNASNPAPDDNSLSPATDNQLLNEKAEKYLREVANIEDMPDAQDQREMDETLKKEADQ